MVQPSRQEPDCRSNQEVLTMQVGEYPPVRDK